MFRLTRWMVFWALFGCGRVSFGVDGGPDDGGRIDAAPVEAGPDSSRFDAGPAGPLVAFVTSTTVVPQDTNRDAADAFCATRAAAGGLTGTFLAWYGRGGDPALRFEGSGGWVRTDTAAVAASLADLTSGRLLHPISHDEFGVDQSETGVLVATASTGTGAQSTANCEGTTMIATGASDRTASRAFSRGNQDCTIPARLYCLEAGRSAQVTVTPTEGRLVFLSTSLFSPGGGTGTPGADALCQADATTASVPGTFLALLARQSGSASTRFTAAGEPWVRPDGVLAGTAIEFLNGDLRAPINVTLSGSYEEGLAWTGSLDFASPASGTACRTDWFSSNSADTGRVGFIDSTTFFFASGTSGQSCDTNLRVYCVEAE